MSFVSLTRIIPCKYFLLNLFLAPHSLLNQLYLTMLLIFLLSYESIHLKQIILYVVYVFVYFFKREVIFFVLVFVLFFLCRSFVMLVVYFCWACMSYHRHHDDYFRFASSTTLLGSLYFVLMSCYQFLMNIRWTNTNRRIITAAMAMPTPT